MKLRKATEMKIVSLKQLYRELEDNKEKNADAIILTAKELDEEKLEGLRSFIRIPVADTLNKSMPGAFTLKHGIEIGKYLGKIYDVTLLYVCCDCGESRSTAVAAALLRRFGKSDAEIWKNPMYHPNLLVYKEQCSAFGIKVSALKLRYLKYINDKALRDVIRRSRKG